MGAGITMGGIIKLILIAIVGLIGAAIGVTIVGGVLIFTGTPQACVDRVVTVSPAASQALEVKWDAFSAAIASAPGSVTFDETEVTSRGVEYLDEKDVPLDELQVYFCPQGYAEATGKMDVLGQTASVLIRGTLDLSGPTPVIDVQSVKAGNLPGGIATTVVNQILDQAGVKELDLDENLTGIAYVDGQATLDGAP